MANRIIFTDLCRASYVHLKEKFAHKQGDTPKYRLSMMFPKTGVLPAHVVANGAPASCNSIMQALDEACMEEFGTDFNATVQQFQIQFPPRWKDGDTDFKKDEQGRLTQEVKEHSAGYWIMNVTSEAPVGCVDHTGENDIDIGQVYSGCWVSCELEVSAYRNSSGIPIISVSLCNLQKCYDDQNIGGGRTPRAASQSFKGRAIADSNCQVGAGQQFNNHASTPAAPGQAAPAPQAAPKLVPVPGAPHTIEACVAGGWTEQQMIDNGIAMYEQAAPAAPAPAPAAPGAPQAPAPAPAPQAAPAAPGTPAAPGAPQAPGQQYTAPPALPGQ